MPQDRSSQDLSSNGPSSQNRSPHGPSSRRRRPATELVLAGRDPFDQFGFVNPPIVRGSTVLYPTADDFLHHRGRYHYGRRGTPTSVALETALTRLTGGDGVVLTPSGLSAIAVALLATLDAGDHLLISDVVYEPTRNFCDATLARLGVEIEYFDPCIGAALAQKFKPNTRVVYAEAPGSQTFELSDIPAFVAAAHARNALVVIDNTWATALGFDAHRHGVDISVEAGTKYLGGHADINLGYVSATGAAWKRVQDTHGALGQCAGPEDIFLALRGLRTLKVRLDQQQAATRTICEWLVERPEMSRILTPMLPADPGHALWRRDFTGGCGLFGVVLKQVPPAAVAAFLDTLELFGMGYSWGGYESLVIPFDAARYRTATAWRPEGPTLRFHIGLEDPADLMEDLERGFAALRAAVESTSNGAR